MGRPGTWTTVANERMPIADVMDALRDLAAEHAANNHETSAAAAVLAYAQRIDS